MNEALFVVAFVTGSFAAVLLIFVGALLWDLLRHKQSIIIEQAERIRALMYIIAEKDKCLAEMTGKEQVLEANWVARNQALAERAGHLRERAAAYRAWMEKVKEVLSASDNLAKKLIDRRSTDSRSQIPEKVEFEGWLNIQTLADLREEIRKVLQS